MAFSLTQNEKDVTSVLFLYGTQTDPKQKTREALHLFFNIVFIVPILLTREVSHICHFGYGIHIIMDHKRRNKIKFTSFVSLNKPVI